ncbi:MAG: hypothetical protein VX733_03600 [Candidatus Latescibacterota bacterium]|nr:hypothetical protein [Candidatus Latescibacterota bacterium]
MFFVTRTLPTLLAFGFGSVAVAIYYIPHASAQTIESELSLWLRIVYAFAYVLGLYSLLNLHADRIKRRIPGWGYSLVAAISFGVMFLFVAYNDGNGPFAPQSETGGYQWIFTYVHVACSSTIFSVLAFFIASAAYRTFRARSVDAAILLLAAIILMIGRVPIGRAIAEFLPVLSSWLMDVPNLAAKRGILLGVSLGAIATSLRIIFGIERSYLGGGGDE